MISGLYLYQIDLSFIVIQTWGFLVSVGFFVALLLSLREAKKNKIDSEVIWNIMILALVGMILGGRFFDFLLSGKINYNFHYGFSFSKGVILSLSLVFLYIKIKKYNFKKIFDCLILGFVSSLIIIRVGCLLISDHVGKITNLPWGMLYLDGNIRHPVALYHILFLTIILFLLFLAKKYFKKEGLILYVFGFLYSFFRFITDFFRCNDLTICDEHLYNLTFSQWVLIPVFLFSLYKIIFEYKLFTCLPCDKIKNIK